MRQFLLFGLAVGISGCGFGLGDVRVAQVLWDANPSLFDKPAPSSEYVTVLVSLGGEQGECARFGSTPSAELSGRAMAYEDAVTSVIEGCSSPKFWIHLPKAELNGDDGTIRIEEGGQALRLDVKGLMARRGFSIAGGEGGAELSVVPGKALQLTWRATSDDTTNFIGDVALVRDGASLLSTFGRTPEFSVTIPSETTEGPAELFLSGSSELTFTDCGGVARCIGHANVRETLSVVVQPAP